MPQARIAVEGCGHLGAALIKGFRRAQAGPVSIFNRTAERARTLAAGFAELRVFDNAEHFDSEACPLLLAIPGKAILEIGPERTARWRESGRTVVSCANGLPLDLLEQRFPGIPWVKAIPAVTAAVGRSITLVAAGASASPALVAAVAALFEAVGRVVVVRDDEVDALSALTSCLPGLLTAMLEELGRTWGLKEDLLLEGALGTLLLADERRLSPSELVASVANRGGLTESGVAVLRDRLPAVFAELREAMERRTRERIGRYREAAQS
jgi:pyrroline-5-carboxylate reductase